MKNKLYRFRWIYPLLLSLAPFSLLAQKENGITRDGNSEMKAQHWDQAETAYRKALEINPNMPQAVFNLGDALYRKEDTAALDWFIKSIPLLKDPKMKAFGWYNVGNVYMKKQQWEKAIDAYKNSLKLNPADMDAKYNLAYAQSKLKKQQQQQQQQQNQQQNQDQNKDQQKDKNNGQPQDQKQDQNGQQQKDPKQQQQNGQSQKLTKEEAKKLLDAVRNEESKLNKKVQKQKASGQPVGTDKDW